MQTSASVRRQIVLGLWLAVMSCALVNIASTALLVHRGDSLEAASQAIGLSLTPKLSEKTGIDSWKTMAAAFKREQERPGEMYWIFFAKGVRFQYPPSALLLMNWIPLPLTMELREKLGTPSRIAVLLTIVFSVAILLSLSPRGRGWVYPMLCVVLMTALGLTFYPLTKGHNLGQIQIYLGALVALTLLLKIRNQRTWAGACLGLCCLVKPQYALVLLWAALRREFRLLLGGILVAAMGVGIAVAQFGVDNHLAYLRFYARSRGPAKRSGPTSPSMVCCIGFWETVKR